LNCAITITGKGDILMATDVQTSRTNLGGLAQETLTDLEKLVEQHFTLWRREMKGELEEAKRAATSLGIGVGAAAASGGLGLLAAVHLLHRITGLPLWASYAGVSGILGAVAAGYLTEGAKEASRVNLLPRQTSEVLGQELAGMRR
jgi:hypothetical protein